MSTDKKVRLSDDKTILINSNNGAGVVLNRAEDVCFCYTCGSKEIWGFSDNRICICGECGLIFEISEITALQSVSISKVLVDHIKNLPKQNSIDEVNFSDDPKVGFEEKLTKLINQHNLENECDIPDHIMASMIMSFICNVLAYNKQILDWHGCDSVTHPKSKESTVTITTWHKRNELDD